MGNGLPQPLRGFAMTHNESFGCAQDDIVFVQLHQFPPQKIMYFVTGTIDIFLSFQYNICGKI